MFTNITTSQVNNWSYPMQYSCNASLCSSDVKKYNNK